MEFSIQDIDDIQAAVSSGIQSLKHLEHDEKLKESIIAQLERQQANLRKLIALRDTMARKNILSITIAV